MQKANIGLIISPLLALLLLDSAQAADAPKPGTNNNVERGWRFGEFKDSNETTSDRQDQRTIKQILAEMLDVQKEQLDTQKEILEAIKEIRNPKPEIITGKDGKPCVANSSVDCYKKVLEPEALRYPVIGKFIDNPTVETATEYLKWYTHHTNRAKDTGFALYLAKTKYGEKATPMNMKRSTFNDPFGHEIQTQGKYVDKLINGELSKEFTLYIFLGRDFNMDAFSMPSYAELPKQLPNVSYNVVFYNNDVKSKLTAYGEKYEDMKTLINGATQQYVGEKYFDQFGVYATPSVSVYLNKDKSLQLLAVGKMGLSGLKEKLMEYLRFKHIIKQDYMVDYKVWGESDYVKDKYYDLYGEVPEVEKYDYKNHDMTPKTPPVAPKE